MHILKLAFLWCIPIIGPASFAGSESLEHAAATKPTRAAISGAWRLVGIEFSGPNGSLADPVFGPNPQGIIIYDSSGWMSVQIVTANRPAISRPVSRTSVMPSAEEAMLAAQAFNTYYAYFGSWEFDAVESVITHHLKASLLPYETGLEYRRQVTFDGNHLKLTVRSQQNGEARQRTLVWARISDSGLVPAASGATQMEPTPPTRVTGSKYGDMPTDYEETVRQYFQEHLRYPESVQYKSISKPEQGYTTVVVGAILMRERREYGWTIKATINAKNSHDLYAGLKTYTFLFRGAKIVDVRLPLPGDEMN